MAKIIDPDDLGTGTTSANADGHLYFNTTDLTIQLSAGTSGASTLDPYDGVTLQTVYSKCKEEWKVDDELIKFPFPFISITGEQFELLNGWDWADDDDSTKTRNLVRDGGWRLYLDDNTSVVEEYMNLTTLGTFDDANADQAYYTQVAGGTPTSIVETGPVNQAITVFTSGGSDYRGFFNIYLREEKKNYDFYDLLTAQSLTSLTYKKYALPLSNSTDLKATHNDTHVASASPYIYIDVKYFNTAQERRIGGTAYLFDVIIQCDTECGSAGDTTAAGSTLQDTDVTMVVDAYAAGTLFVQGPSAATDAGATFNIVSNTADTFTVDGGTFAETRADLDWYCTSAAVLDATTAEIYEKVQYELRQTGDIDYGPDTVRGDTASSLLSFVGDTLVTATGVFIDSFRSADTNSIEFYDTIGLQRLFPYVAAGAIAFNDNLQSDGDATYWMFFTSANGNDYGTTNAIIVNDASDTPAEIAGTVGAQASIAFTFDYDFNVQGGRTQATDAPVTIVAIGLDTGQYVKTTGTIERSKVNNFSLVAALERNYSNPA